jgi:hypothetical protein
VTPAEVAAWLNGRAASYGSDALKLRATGDADTAFVFESVRDELRRCVTELRNNPRNDWRGNAPF